MDVAAILNDLNAAERAFERVRQEIDSVTEADFTAMNVDVVSATSSVLGVADRIIELRERFARLPEFDITHVDKLVDYATAAWYAFISNLPEPEAEEFGALMQECRALRAKFLMWAEPLAANGDFDATAIARIKEGSGNKDVPSDVVALVGLYRSKWDAVENLCAVTEADLDRGAQIGPFTFATVSQREQRRSRIATEDSRRVRAAWTLLDRAYDQCRRGLAFLLWNADDVDRIAPSLRRNVGPRQRPASAAGSAQPAPSAPPPADGNSPRGSDRTAENRAEAG